MGDFIEEIEDKLKFKTKSNVNTGMIFSTQGSAGANNEKLAKLLTSFDFVIALMKWENKPLAKFSNIVTQYQASLDSKYHNDFKEVLIAEEIERRREERKGLSILQQ